MYQELINKKWQQFHEFKSLLKRTDYQDHRRHDDPEKIMAEEIEIARNNARDRVNELEAEIAELELLQAEIVQSENDLGIEEG